MKNIKSMRTYYDKLAEQEKEKKEKNSKAWAALAFFIIFMTLSSLVTTGTFMLFMSADSNVFENLFLAGLIGSYCTIIFMVMFENLFTKTKEGKR